jgi:hypothetical protein
MTERWRTAHDLQAARERIVADIPGWVPPAAHGTVLVTPDGTASLLAVNDGTAVLSAAVLARVCGHASGTRTVELTVDQVRRGVDDLAPAEAATHVGHPNLAAWRSLLGAFAFDPECRAYAVFVQDLGDELSSRYDEMLRVTLADERAASRPPAAPAQAPTVGGPVAPVDVQLRAGVMADVPAVLAFWALAAEDAHRPPDDRAVLNS